MCDLFVSLQVESRNAELSLLLNKLQSEDAALRDSLTKLGSMNEGLAQDKADLNTYILQVWMSCSFNAVTCINEDKSSHFYLSLTSHMMLSLFILF